MSLMLYYDLLSQPSRALYIFFKTVGIDFEPKVLHLGRGDQLLPSFRKVNPFHKVPVIVHDGFVLTESVAIARYICREYNLPDHWYPKDSRAQAKVDEYLEWQHLNTRLHCNSYYYLKVLMRRFEAREPTISELEQHLQRMEICLDQIENIWLKDKSFLIGDEISIADIFGACEIEHARMAEFDPRKNRPKLSAWLDRVIQATSPHYDEAHAIVDKLIVRNREKAKLFEQSLKVKSRL
ncbi:hypothetical protein TKK_0012152 [Trichogramma kaykai]|uniref:glutathione transferase n=1 Tax=Trichogramma kaykai TaxID=54128 RepID=A0ABD2WM67_9HYME